MDDVYFTDVCTDSNLNCLHGGYPDPVNCTICRCPDPFTGTECENLVEGSDGKNLCPYAKYDMFIARFR